MLRQGLAQVAAANIAEEEEEEEEDREPLLSDLATIERH